MRNGHDFVSYCVQEEERLKQERTGSAHVVSNSKEKKRAKEKELRSPRIKLLKVQHKKNKIKVTIVSFAVSLDM